MAKQLYKLKGFAYLRSDIKDKNSDLSASRALLKSAKSFQKAKGDSKSVEEHIQKLRAKYIRQQQEVDVSEELKRGRATFINFKKKMIKQLTEEELLANQSYLELEKLCD